MATMPLARHKPARASVLMYHRVAAAGVFDFSLDAWNVAPGRLEQQLQWLAKNADCRPLAEAMQERPPAGRQRPVVALTFDDGYANFHHAVLPLLKRYQIPATLFVVTRHVSSSEPYPFDRWGQKNRARTARLPGAPSLGRNWRIV